MVDWILIVFLVHGGIVKKIEPHFPTHFECASFEEEITRKNNYSGYWKTYSFGCHRGGDV